MKPLAPFTPAKVYPAWMMARCIAFPFPVPFLARVTSAERYRVILAKHRRPGGSRRDAGARYANARILAGATESTKPIPRRDRLGERVGCWNPKTRPNVEAKGRQLMSEAIHKVSVWSHRGLVPAAVWSINCRPSRLFTRFPSKWSVVIYGPRPVGWGVDAVFGCDFSTQ